MRNKGTWSVDISKCGNVPCSIQPHLPSKYIPVHFMKWNSLVCVGLARGKFHVPSSTMRESWRLSLSSPWYSRGAARCRPPPQTFRPERAMRVGGASGSHSSQWLHLQRGQHLSSLLTVRKPLASWFWLLATGLCGPASSQAQSSEFPWIPQIPAILQQMLFCVSWQKWISIVCNQKTVTDVGLYSKPVVK